MSASARVHELVEAKLTGRVCDVVAFMDAFLEIVAAAGGVHCCMAGTRGLHFDWPDGSSCEVEVDSARGKLRTLCARLSVLCSAASPYGGEGTIRFEPTSDNNTAHLLVRFQNTLADHQFTITPAKIDS